jgi:hypothetical protein
MRIKLDGSERIGILSNGQPFVMVRLDLPPGTYTFAASGTVSQEEYNGLTFRDPAEGCALSAAGNELQRTPFDRHELQRQISLNSAVQLPSGGVVSATCHTRGRRVRRLRVPPRRHIGGRTRMNLHAEHNPVGSPGSRR